MHDISVESLLDIATANMKLYGNHVITNRALPDYRDGLKPIHRRILWTMNMKPLTLHFNGPFVKSARVVGNCFIAGTNISLENSKKDISVVEIDEIAKTSRGYYKITNLFHNPPSKIAQVKLKNKMEVCCTTDQEFKVKISGQFYWKKASELCPGDCVVVESD